MSRGAHRRRAETVDRALPGPGLLSKTPSMGVELVPINANNWRGTLAVRVSEQQLRFVADHQPVALVILAKAYVRPGGHDWEPLAIVERPSGIIGVVAFAHAPTESEMVNLVVDERSQGRGLGGAAVEAAVEHVRLRRPACRTLTLTVQPENEGALRLYRRHGFEPTGSFRRGEPVLARDLLR